MEKWNHGKKDAGGDRILSRRKNDLKGMPGIVLIERVKHKMKPGQSPNQPLAAE
jgi:hypothetical protein